MGTTIPTSQMKKLLTKSHRVPICIGVQRLQNQQERASGQMDACVPQRAREALGCISGRGVSQFSPADRGATTLLLEQKNKDTHNNFHQGSGRRLKKGNSVMTKVL